MVLESYFSTFPLTSAVAVGTAISSFAGRIEVSFINSQLKHNVLVQMEQCELMP